MTVQFILQVLAVVIRTGFNTSKGGLVRSIMYPPPVDFKFEQDSYKFVILLAGIASIGVIYTIVTKAIRGVPSNHIALEALDLITIVVPPALPAAMTVGRLVAQRRLEKNKIYCTSPRTINVSGSIDCICFDKTGTLTEDGLDMWGVVSSVDRKFQPPVKDIASLPLNDLLIGMVTCHGITIIENQPVGDPLDLKMFESTGWTLEEPDVSDTSKFSMLFPTIVRPPKGSKLLKKLPTEIRISLSRQNSMSSDVMDNISLNNLDTTLAASTTELGEQGLEIGIVRQFPFTSSLQRMSVITRTLGANHYDLYCKGSPEMILSLSRAESSKCCDKNDVLCLNKYLFFCFFLFLNYNQSRCFYSSTRLWHRVARLYFRGLPCDRPRAQILEPSSLRQGSTIESRVCRVRPHVLGVRYNGKQIETGNDTCDQRSKHCLHKNRNGDWRQHADCALSREGLRYRETRYTRYRGLCHPTESDEAADLLHEEQQRAVNDTRGS